MSHPTLIKGDLFNDERGVLAFVNDFKLDSCSIKRFYIVKNYNNNFIRAWHGHKYESKFVYCLKGSAKICCVKISNFKKPNKKEAVYTFNLSQNKPSVLYIPKGFANGFMNTEPDTNLIFFSDKSLDESKNDDYRYEYNYWDPWKVKFY